MMDGFYARTALETLTGYGWLVSVGNVQSRPTKGGSSLGILFENPLKLHTHSLAYTSYVQTVWTTSIVVDFGLLAT